MAVGLHPSGVVLVEEEHVLVGGKSPGLLGDDLLSRVTDLPDVDHGLEPEDPGHLGLLVGLLLGVDLGHGVLDDLDTLIKVGEELAGLGLSEASVLHGGDDVLVDHVNHTQSLELDVSDVVVVEDGLPGLALGLGHDPELLEELHVLVHDNGVVGLYTAVNPPDSTSGEHLLVVLVVVVAVEDDPPALVEVVSGDGSGRFAGLDPLGELAELLGGDGVKGHVDHAAVDGGSDGAELEPAAPVGERRGPVPVLGRDLEGLDRLGSQVKGLLSGVVLGSSVSLLEGLEVVGHVVSEVGGDDGGGGLASSEAELVTGVGDGHPEDVSVLLESGNQSGNDGREGGSVAVGAGVHVGGVHQVEGLSVGGLGGGETPVVVLSAAVDVGEGLLLQESSEAVLGGDLLDDLHHHDVLVDLSRVHAEEGGELVLVGGDLAVAGLEGDSHLPALLLDLLHAGEGRGGHGRGSHVVVAHLLPAGGVLAHDGAAGHLKIQATEVGIAGDEEELLLQSNVGNETLLEVLVLGSEGLEETGSVLAHGLVTPEKGCLLVEGGSVVADEGGRHEDHIAPQEDAAARVNG